MSGDEWFGMNGADRRYGAGVVVAVCRGKVGVRELEKLSVELVDQGS